MKKLLSILGTVTLLGAGTTSISACHIYQTNEQKDNSIVPDDKTDELEDLLVMISNDITNNLGAVVNESQNLFRLANVGTPEVPYWEFKQFLEDLTTKNPNHAVEIQEQNKKKLIFNLLTPIIKKINYELSTNKKYLALFNNIESNNILTVNFDRTTFNLMPFDFNGVIQALGKIKNQTVLAAIQQELDKFGSDRLYDIYRVLCSLKLQLNYFKDGHLETMDINYDNLNLYFSANNLDDFKQLREFIIVALQDYFSYNATEIDLANLDDKYQEFKKLNHDNFSDQDQAFLSNNIFQVLHEKLFEGLENFKVNDYHFELEDEFLKERGYSFKDVNLTTIKKGWPTTIKSEWQHLCQVEEINFINRITKFLKNSYNIDFNNIPDNNRIYAIGQFFFNSLEFEGFNLGTIAINLVLKKAASRELSSNYFIEIILDYFNKDYFNQMFDYQPDQAINFYLKDNLLNNLSLFEQLPSRLGSYAFNNLLSIYNNTFTAYKTGIKVGNTNIEINSDLGGKIQFLGYQDDDYKDLKYEIDQDNHQIVFKNIYLPYSYSLGVKVNGYFLHFYRTDLSFKPMTVNFKFSNDYWRKLGFLQLDNSWTIDDLIRI
ncbi:hypothetical protein [Spiroplasma eriocheiris]|uniref:Lipoprotein n=1 Tax=Spiroplasma eriocheiris TaxID=315358 RepID=A0A0H3XHW1_9MOLU|nr:hypothetical protein [Spiroplasma eriocheiris]AHF57539.1 hypothetical protein SPE_0410 [Spiroplasma eriocheiris CCTCC M 207170]AKM53995.1 hypothetical protein SERIO_v1c04160 [Spiroplasma eriocheiris]